MYKALYNITYIYIYTFLNLFNWRLITLQYCIGFVIHQHESTTRVHVFPILNPSHLPPRIIPLGHPRAPAPMHHALSCIGDRLAIHFLHDSIHVSMPFSQIIPPCPLPQSPKVCSVHLCLFCYLTYRIIVTIFLNSIYMS